MLQNIEISGISVHQIHYYQMNKYELDYILLVILFDFHQKEYYITMAGSFNLSLIKRRKIYDDTGNSFHHNLGITCQIYKNCIIAYRKFHCHNSFHNSELQKFHAEDLPSRLKFDLSSDQEKWTTFIQQLYLSLSSKQDSRLRKQKTLS